MKELRILCLHKKSLWDMSMDRTVFYGYSSISKHKGVVDFVYSGIGWENYEVDSSVVDNINRIYCGRDKPTVLLVYGGSEYLGLRDVRILKCSLGRMRHIKRV